MAKAPAGYSGTPLPKKLGMREGTRVALVGAPRDFATTLGALPAGVRARRSLPRAATPSLDVIVVFVTSVDALAKHFDAARARLAPSGGLWVAWPKKTSGVTTDLDEASVRAFGLASGLVDNKVCAIDATWSGLRFVIRLRDR